MPRRAILLTEILLQNKVITRDQLEKALEIQKERKERIGRILVELGYVREKDIAMGLAQQFGLAYVSLSHYKIPGRLIQSFSGYFASKYCVIPIDRLGDLLTIAIADPTDLTAVEFIAAITQCRVMAVVATETDIRDHIAKYYDQTDVISDIGKALVERGKISTEELTARLQKFRPGATADFLSIWSDINEKEIYQIFSQLVGIPLYDLRGKSLKSDAMDLISPYTAMKYAVLPLERTSQLVTVALANPLDSDAVETALTLTTAGLRIVLSSRSQIIETISRYYQVEKVPVVEKIPGPLIPPVSPKDIKSLTSEMPVREAPPVTSELTFTVEQGTLEELLIRRERIRPAEWLEIKSQLEKIGGTLEDFLFDRGLIDEEELAKILEEELNIHYINALEYEINPWALGTVPIGVIQKYRVFPLDKLGKSITLAVVNPLNQKALEEIKKILKYDVNLVISTRSQLQTLINRYFKSAE